MSFILDALKKSEAERQRQASPGLIEPALARPRSGPTPLTIGLLTLLGVNSLVLGVVLLRRPAANAPPLARFAATGTAPLGATRAPPRSAVPAGTTAAPLPAPGTAASPGTAPSAGEASGFAPEIPVTSPDNPIVTEARAHLSATDAAAPTPGDAAAAAAVTGGGADLEPLPTLAQMRVTGADALPPLHLDVHVYSPDPAQRFVFINGHKYVEGATLVEGPRVVRIRPDGVELAYHGQRFLLPRQ